MVNTLGWPSLRPLQQQAIEPVMAGEHAVMLAPTAGGKTEAATFPILSRMLTEDWNGLSVLYVCPLKALLNNLFPRLESYAQMVGRTAGVWHGDIGRGVRGRMLAEPPDILLTTPESLEVMLISQTIDARAFLGNVRTVVVDEVHAFAGDDRGWHLLSLLERVSHLAGGPVQRIGLSATVGDPGGLLEWLKGSDTGRAGGVINPAADATTDQTEITVDFVGTIDNAATVISRLHRGEKRLVFVDSRARVEELSTALRLLDVATFVSHSSLSADERRYAERAFTEARDCVIVATSTLELGIDVGDLDRVIQIDAPSTVASFLQRIGRTGRRSGTSRNCLFLCTKDAAVLQAAGLLALWEDGWVEPVTPPPAPAHLFAQQLMALSLQEGRVGRQLWREWMGPLPAFAAMDPEPVEEIVEWMVNQAILVDEGGMLSFGIEGEESYGRRHFLDLIAVFTAAPLMTVWHGRRELGSIDPLSLQRRQDGPAVILLGGRPWRVKDVDWPRRLVFVEPSDDMGKSRWNSGGPAISYELAQAMARVLEGHTPGVTWSQRAKSVLAQQRSWHEWASPDGTVVGSDGGRPVWWTFAGTKANLALTEHLDCAGSVNAATELYVPLRPGTTQAGATAAIAELKRSDASDLLPGVSPGAVTGLKFNECLPLPLAMHTLAERLRDDDAVAATLEKALRAIA
ncbi:Helicase domain protein [Euzebya pacifica]|uniref:Helicase domain protein n=1 Tax=Euzebya pacifica TaxID=1608957 RepID=A0A346XRX1_9ACTN|nr:Helicase domain protein [Euzebya pacifica]